MLNQKYHHSKFLLKVSALLLILVLSKGQKEHQNDAKLNLVAKNSVAETASKSDKNGVFNAFSKSVNNYLK